MLLPSTNSQYEVSFQNLICTKKNIIQAIVEHRAADDDDFEEVLVEDENGEGNLNTTL